MKNVSSDGAKFISINTPRANSDYKILIAYIGKLKCQDMSARILLTIVMCVRTPMKYFSLLLTTS